MYSSIVIIDDMNQDMVMLLICQYWYNVCKKPVFLLIGKWVG